MNIPTKLAALSWRSDYEKTSKTSILRVSAMCLALAGAFAGIAGIEKAEAVTSSGLTTLHQFTGGADGATIYKGVAIDETGNLYGIAFYGANACPDSFQFANVGCGVVWKLDTNNNFSTLVTFLGASNGADPDGNLKIRGNKIYGNTYTGGASNLGTVFEVKTDGTGFKTLYTFTNENFGAHPQSFPRFDSAGDMFSTAPYGGQGFTGTDFTGNGVLFRLTKASGYSAYDVEHYFTGGADGGDPQRIFKHESSQTFFGSTWLAVHVAAQACRPRDAASFFPTSRRISASRFSTHSRAAPTAMSLPWPASRRMAMSMAQRTLAEPMAMARCSN